MTITIGSIWIPILINVILLIWCWVSAMNDSGWFAGAAQALGFVLGTLFVWLIYFATMYFTLI